MCKIQMQGSSVFGSFGSFPKTIGGPDLPRGCYCLLDVGQQTFLGLGLHRWLLGELFYLGPKRRNLPVLFSILTQNVSCGFWLLWHSTEHLWHSQKATSVMRRSWTLAPYSNALTCSSAFFCSASRSADFSRKPSLTSSRVWRKSNSLFSKDKINWRTEHLLFYVHRRSPSKKRT